MICCFAFQYIQQAHLCILAAKAIECIFPIYGSCCMAHKGSDHRITFLPIRCEQLPLLSIAIHRRIYILLIFFMLFHQTDRRNKF